MNFAQKKGGNSVKWAYDETQRWNNPTKLSVSTSTVNEFTCRSQERSLILSCKFTYLFLGTYFLYIGPRISERRKKKSYAFIYICK